MRKLSLFFCVFLFLLLVLAPSIFSQEATDYYRMGYDNFNKGNFNQAVSDYTKAIELNKNYKDAYLARGLVYGQLNNFDKSIEDCTKVIELDSKNIDAYRARGNAYDSQGKFDLAVTDYTKAIEINPTVNAYDDRAITYGKKGDFEKAFSDFNKAIEIDPNDARPYYDRGLAYNMQGKTEEAIADYTKMLELEPNSPNGLNNRGISYSDIEEYDKAIDDFSRAIELVPIEVEPGHVPPYMGRAKAYFMKGDYDKALADCDKVLKIHPQFAEVSLLRQNIFSFKESRPAAEGEIFSQKEGLFKVALPEGWRWIENPGGVAIISPKLKGVISIQFQPATTISDVNMKEELKRANKFVIESLVKPANGIIVDEKETEVNGVYARRLDFSLPAPGHSVNTTYISLFKKGNAFTIRFASNNEAERSALEKIVQMLQFPDVQNLQSAKESKNQPTQKGKNSRVALILKSGKKVEGQIIEHNDDYIKLDFEGVALTFFNDEIETIE